MTTGPTLNAAPAGWLAPSIATRLEQEETTAFRLHSTADGWVERLGDDLLICSRHEEAQAAMRAGAEAWGAAASWVPRRIFAKHLPRQNADRVTPVQVAGESDPSSSGAATENGVRYGLDFAAGYSTGLFLDQRANRAAVRARRPPRLLNLFAYTCSFSVVAALAGGQTVSVDLSRKSLDRGRANFQLNGLDDTAHQFIADDALRVLPRLARRGEKFDCLILDPPTFSRNERGGRFQVERDFEALLHASLEVAAPGASLLLSTNCQRLDRRALEGIGRYAFKLLRLSGAFHVEPELPDLPRAFGATTLWLKLNR